MALRKTTALLNHKLHGTNGDIGVIEDIYVNTLTWEVRYLLVRTGDWLNGRPVLISMHALQTPRWDSNITPTSISREQVAEAPQWEGGLPLPRQYEQLLHDHYEWPFSTEAGEDEVGLVNEHLHSTEQLLGSRVIAQDGDVGEVAGLVLNDENWRLFYLILDTARWLNSGRLVLLTPSWVDNINWEAGEIRLELARELIENSPTFDPAVLNRQDEDDEPVEKGERSIHWSEDSPDINLGDDFKS